MFLYHRVRKRMRRTYRPLTVLYALRDTASTWRKLGVSHRCSSDKFFLPCESARWESMRQKVCKCHQWLPRSLFLTLHCMLGGNPENFLSGHDAHSWKVLGVAVCVHLGNHKMQYTRRYSDQEPTSDHSNRKISDFFLVFCVRIGWLKFVFKKLER